MPVSTAIAHRDDLLDSIRAASAVATARAEGALLHLNVDHFRATLRSYPGRSDGVLERLAAAVHEVARTFGCTGRLGLDEFGVVLPPGTRRSPLEIARAIVEHIAGTDFGTPGEEPLYVTVSVGVAPITSPDQPLDEVLCTAAAAARLARRSGGHRAHALRPDDALALGDVHAVRMLPRVREAIRDGRLLLHCQPIVPLRPAAGRPPAAEVLVRMLATTGELLPPSEFLPVAERFRLTSLIDREVIDRSCHWLESRANSWVDLDFLTVNLHAHSLDDSELTDWLVQRVAGARFPADRLCIEITESGAFQNLDRARHLLQQLRDIGCHLALDDFGAGYSSLAQFQALPVDIVKLDGGFMTHVVEDPAARELVAWVCDLCRAADRLTVAEHCSTPAIIETVRHLGIDYAQGHAVCEPFPLDRLLPVSPPNHVQLKLA
jgi:diguanylate cyclase (GGDEF)-like protein